MIEVPAERFDQMVRDALAEIPPELARSMDNVVILVEDRPDDDRPLYGLYQGVPLTNRGTYAGALPDRITIYQGVISERCRTEQEVAARVRVTVLHEVGHHFGMSDARLQELGWA